MCKNLGSIKSSISPAMIVKDWHCFASILIIRLNILNDVVKWADILALLI